MWSTISGSLPAIVVSLTLAGVGGNVFQTVNKASVAQHAPPELVGTVMGMSGEPIFIAACLLPAVSACLPACVPLPAGVRTILSDRSRVLRRFLVRPRPLNGWTVRKNASSGFVALFLSFCGYRFAKGFLRPCVVWLVENHKLLRRTCVRVPWHEFETALPRERCKRLQ